MFFLQLLRVEFSNFLLGLKFVAVEFENAKIGPKKANFAKSAHLYPCKIAVVQFQEKFSFLKKVLLPKILLRLPTVHYGCYLQVSLRCELYTVSTTWLFFAISHLAIIMKSDHDQKQPSSTATPYISTVHYGLQKNVG